MESPFNKQAVEDCLLQLVFDVDDYDFVKARERPDFQLQRSPEEAFGVEITELFPTQADARSQRIPSYLPDLLAGGEHMHREDVSELKVVTVQITDEHGGVKARDVPAVMQENPAPSLYRDKLRDTIVRKNERAAGYDAGLSFTCLIIMDWFRHKSETDKMVSLNTILGEGGRSALQSSPFREIYLASIDAERNLVYRPLRMICLWESFYMAAAAAENFDDGLLGRLSREQFISVFVHLMRVLGIPCDFSVMEGQPVAMVPGSAARISVEDKIELLNMFDHPQAVALALPSCPISGSLLGKFAKHFRDYMEANEFSCGLSLPCGINSEAELLRLMVDQEA